MSTAEDVVKSDEERSSDSESEGTDSFIDSDEEHSDSESDDEDSESSSSGSSDEGSTRSKGYRDSGYATAMAIMEEPSMTYRTPGQKRLADVIEKYSSVIETAYKPVMPRKPKKASK
jgi:hypothetical protein